MREKLEIILSVITSSLISIYIELYVMKEEDFLKFAFGELLIGLSIFVLILLLFDIANKREIRKKKKRGRTNGKTS